MGWGVRTLQDIPQGTFVCEWASLIFSFSFTGYLCLSGNPTCTYMCVFRRCIVFKCMVPNVHRQTTVPELTPMCVYSFMCTYASHTAFSMQVCRGDCLRCRSWCQRKWFLPFQSGQQGSVTLNVLALKCLWRRQEDYLCFVFGSPITSSSSISCLILVTLSACIACCPLSCWCMLSWLWLLGLIDQMNWMETWRAHFTACLLSATAAHTSYKWPAFLNIFDCDKCVIYRTLV